MMKVCLKCGTAVHDRLPHCTGCGGREFAAPGDVPPGHPFAEPDGLPAPRHHVAAQYVGVVVGLTCFVGILALPYAFGSDPFWFRLSSLPVVGLVAVALGVIAYVGGGRLFDHLLPARRSRSPEPVEDEPAENDVVLSVPGHGPAGVGAELTSYSASRALLVRETNGDRHYLVELADRGVVLHFEEDRLQPAPSCPAVDSVFPCASFTLLDLGPVLGLRCDGPRLEPELAGREAHPDEFGAGVLPAHGQLVARDYDRVREHLAVPAPDDPD